MIDVALVTWFWLRAVLSTTGVPAVILVAVKSVVVLAGVYLITITPPAPAPEVIEVPLWLVIPPPPPP